MHCIFYDKFIYVSHTHKSFCLCLSLSFAISKTTYLPFLLLVLMYYPDNRLRGPTVCAGTSDDYDYTNHGTHLASIAAGAKYGVGKSTIIHSIQVLDANGEGTVASVLCGIEKLIQDGLDYNSENAPRKLRAVVNLSIGVNGRSDVLDKAVEDLIELGYVVVIAAGNNDGE